MKSPAFFAIGALAFGIAQGAWSVGHAHGLWRGTWMLKTGSGVAACFVLFALVAAVACAFRDRGRGLGDCIAALVAGAVVALAVALMIVGPGSIWPLVIALDAVIIALAVGVGAALSPVIRAAAGR
jgi:hypothetical protein